MKKTIAVGSDHAGYQYKEAIKHYLLLKGHAVTDFGPESEQPVDYPDIIRPTAQSVAAGEHDYGIVLGGSGNGEAMVANKVPGIRCGICWSTDSARLCKEHNNANMISLGQRMITQAEAISFVDTWLVAQFMGGRHQKRIDKIEGIIE
jgi:ribose 5-phosphate isomerase B